MIKQNQRYFAQMSASLDDKLQVAEYVVGTNVLDAGCGLGELVCELKEKGYNAKGLDSSLFVNESVSSILKEDFIHGDILNIDTYMKGHFFDTVIFNSVLHEIYSYNGRKSSSVIGVLEKTYNALPLGGRIIIRDGVRPEDRNKLVRITFKNINDILFLTEFKKRTVVEYFYYKQIDELTYEMSYLDAMEFLYTYTWGWGSFDREVQEQYGLYTLEEYKNQINHYLKGSNIIYDYSYTQDGYVTNLFDKISLRNVDGSYCHLPDTNMVIVIEKGLQK